jgi:putative oxidoreductase
MGIPAFVTWLVIIAEFFGSIAIFFGFLTRVVACSYIIIMLGAIFLAHHWQNGFLMNYWGKNPGEGWEYLFLIIIVCYVLVRKGSGSISIDRALSRKLSKPN